MLQSSAGSDGTLAGEAGQQRPRSPAVTVAAVAGGPLRPRQRGLGGPGVTLRHFLPLSCHLPKNARHDWKLAQRTENVRPGGRGRAADTMNFPASADRGGRVLPLPAGAERQREKKPRSDVCETGVPRSAWGSVPERNTLATCQLTTPGVWNNMFP